MPPRQHVFERGAIGVGLAALGLSQGGRWGWDDARTIVALAGGVTATIAAVLRSRRVAAPAIETALWKHRTFAFANGASLLYGMSLYAWMLIGVLVLTQHPRSAATFEHVYLFCALAILCAAIVGLGLTLHPVAAIAEVDDAKRVDPGEPFRLPWRRFVVVGDSLAEGIGDPTPG